ncbi:uncharacterized protein [Asterias amurensis]|uniref:uncharacterized protein isoform X1 n=1 Tax=Asterias amurensis TaxID=7602 RepID=UPI003AB2FA06
MAESSLGRGVADGSPGYERDLPRKEGKTKRSENHNASNNNLVEDSSTRRCSCCPYGYHIDLDFLDFCQDISSGANLKKFKKVKRSRPRHEAVKSIKPPPPLVPPRSVSVTKHQKWKRQRDNLEADKILEKENAAFAATYSQFANLIRRRYMSEDGNCSDSPDRNSYDRNSYIPMDTQSLPPLPLDVSLSDVETESVSSCYNIPPAMDRRRSLPGENPLDDEDPGNYLGIPHHLQATNLLRMSMQSGSNSSISSTSSLNFSHASLSNQNSNGYGPSPSPLLGQAFFNSLEGSLASGRSTPSSISTTALSGVRQQMAAALSRLKQLEDQVKAIPVLQVKISVLKEEKRLLMLQLKSKNKRPDSRSIAIGDGYTDCNYANSEGETELTDGYQNDDYNTNQPQISAVSALQRIGKAKPDLAAKKAIVTPVQRAPVATRSVGVDVNFVGKSETKSIGINVSADDQLKTRVNGWNGQHLNDDLLAQENIIQMSSVSRQHSLPPNYRANETDNNMQGKVAAQEHYKRAMKAGRVNSLPDLSFSPPPVAPKPRIRHVGINTSLTESRDKSVMVLPKVSSQETSTLYITTVEQGVETEIDVVSQGTGTDRTVLKECTTNTDNPTLKDRSTSMEPVVSSFRDRGLNTDVIQTRISATNTGPMVLKKPGQSVACNTDTVEFAPQTVTKESGTNPDIVIACAQATNTECVECVDFGTEVHIMVQDSSTSTLSTQLKEQCVGVDLQITVPTTDSFTSTESVALNDCTTNTEKVPMTSQGVDCIIETLDHFTSTDSTEVNHESTNTECASQSHVGVDCIPDVVESSTLTITSEISDGSTNTDAPEVSSRGVDCIVETSDQSVDTVDQLVVECVDEDIVVQSVNENLMAAMPAFKPETADKALSTLIIAETVECGTEMDAQEGVETADKSSSALISAETVEFGTEMEVLQVTDGSTMYELTTTEFGTVTEQLGLEMGINTDQQELTSVGCNTKTLPTVADAGVEVNLIEKVTKPVVSSVATSYDVDNSRTLGVGSCSVYDTICDRCTNLTTCSVAVGSSENPTSRTIGTSSSITTKTVGVGLSATALISMGVGDRNIDEPLCNICDRPLMKTVSTEITGPQTCDHAVGDSRIAGQITEGVGDCTLTDRICEHCDTMTVSSVGVGNTDINEYTKTQSVQVGFVPIEAPLSQSSVQGTLARPRLSQLEDILASYSPDSIDSPFHENPLTTDPNESPVFLPQYHSPYQELSTPEQDPESPIQRELVSTEKSAVLAHRNIPGNNNIAKAGYQEIPDGTDQWNRQEDRVISMATSSHSSSELQTMHQSSVTMTTRTTKTTTSQSLQTKTAKTGRGDRELDYEEDDFMTDGFANLHAILAGASPQTREGSTLMEQSIQERETELRKGVTNTAPGHVEMSSSEDSSDSESETTTESSESSETMSTSIEGGSYDGKVIKLIKKGQRKKKNGNVERTRPVDRERYTLPVEVTKACSALGKLMEMSGDSNAKDMTTCLSTITKEWFRVTSQKTSDPYQVEDILSALAEMGKSILEKIVNISDANGNTALHYSVSHGNFTIADLLLEAQVCDVDRPNRAGYTAIMLASLATLQSEKQRQTLAKLFHLGNVNVRATQAGQTALMLAVSHGRLDMVKLLLDAGTDVNIQDEDGSTALMCASEHGHQEIVKVLLAHPQCDPALLDNDGSSAFSIAMEAGHKNIGVLLYAQLNFAKQAGSPKRRAQSASPRFPAYTYSFINLSRSAVSPGPASPSPSPSPSLSSLSPSPSPSLSSASSFSDLRSMTSHGSSRSRSVSPNSRAPTFRHFYPARPVQQSSSTTSLRTSGLKSPSPRGAASLRQASRGSKAGVKSPSTVKRSVGTVPGSQRPCSVGTKQATSPTRPTATSRISKSNDKFSTM